MVRTFQRKPLLPYSEQLKVEEGRISATLVFIFQHTRDQNPDDRNMNKTDRSASNLAPKNNGLVIELSVIL